MLSPHASPTIAAAIGSAIAVIVPNTRTRISIAAQIPISSLISVAGSVILSPSCPPASTCTPVRCAGSAAVSRIASASSTARSPRAVAGKTVAYAVLPSAETVVLPSSSGLLTLATSSARDSAWSDASTTGRCSSSVRVPSLVWNTIGLASDSSDENERAMMSVAAALSEPDTVTELEYLVPAAWLAKPRPSRSRSQTPMTSARRRAEKTATRCNRDDTITSGDGVTGRG